MVDRIKRISGIVLIGLTALGALAGDKPAAGGVVLKADYGPSSLPNALA